MEPFINSLEQGPGHTVDGIGQGEEEPGESEDIDARHGAASSSSPFSRSQEPKT